MVYGFLHGAWIKGILAGITLAMAILPEEFPLVLTVFLVLGAWRMSQNKVLSRRSAAIEALGAVTVLCTDKTGTLTLNRMRVAALITDSGLAAIPPTDRPDLPEDFHALAEFAILASRPDPFDSMERAFVDYGARTLAGSEHLHTDWTLAFSYPLTPDLLAMSQVWQGKDATGYIIAAKGAPETVVDLCHLPAEQIAGIRRSIASLAAQGLRVLAVARADWADPTWPASQHDFAFRVMGLIGLADPLRPEVPAAVATCKAGGIRVVMIRGDHPATALAIAKQAGISAENTLSGMDIASMDENAFAKAIAQTSVFARIMPEQKLRLIQAFAASG